jgi:hypothetical protein
MECN